MNRRNFLKMVGFAGAALTIKQAEDLAFGGAVLHDDLSAEVAAFKAYLGYNGDYTHDDNLCQAALQKGVSYADLFASLTGDHCWRGPKNDGFAAGACLTNRRLRLMVGRYLKKSAPHTYTEQYLDLCNQCRTVDQKSGQYWRRCRAWYGLDHSKGWIDRELAVAA